MYEPPWLTQSGGTATCFIIFNVLALYGAFICKLHKDKPNLAKALLVLFIGCAFAFATPPNQAPDESSHFMRAYAMYQGEFTFDSGHKYPNAANLFAEDFPVMYNNGYPAKEGHTIAECFQKYRADLASGRRVPNMKIIIFQTIPYLFAFLLMSFASLFSKDILFMFYVCRLSNVIFYNLCMLIALKITQRHKNLLFCIGSLPLTLFVISSCNSDGFLFGLMLLLFALCLRNEFTENEAIVFMFIFSLLCIHKMNYVIFIVLPLLYHKEQWKVYDANGKNEKELVPQWVILMASMLFLMIFALAHNGYTTHYSNYGPLGRLMPDSDPSEQLKYIFAYPIRFVVIACDTLLQNNFFLFDGGLFGWLDVNLKLISVLTPILFLLYCVHETNEFEKQDTPSAVRTVIVFVISSIGIYCFNLGGLYLTWTPVSLPQIIGLQMRYFIPAFMGLALLLSFTLHRCGVRSTKSKESILLMSTYSLNSLAIYLMLQAYYLPSLI